MTRWRSVVPAGLPLRLLRGAALGALPSLVCNGLLYLILRESVRSSKWGVRGHELLGLVGVGCGLASLVLLCAFAVGRRGATVSFGLAAALVVAVPMPVAWRLGWEARAVGLAEFAERSGGLVRAIRAYESERGRPPASLEDLVPEFIAAVPETGMATCPHYTYRTREKWPGMVFLEDWMLEVATPSSSIASWDWMEFHSSESRAAGLVEEGVAHRVGDWTY